jgi:hypothetical protein
MRWAVTCRGWRRSYMDEGSAVAALAVDLRERRETSARWEDRRCEADDIGGWIDGGGDLADAVGGMA